MTLVCIEECLQSTGGMLFIGFYCVLVHNFIQHAHYGNTQEMFVLSQEDK